MPIAPCTVASLDIWGDCYEDPDHLHRITVRWLRNHWLIGHLFDGPSGGLRTRKRLQLVIRLQGRITRFIRLSLGLSDATHIGEPNARSAPTPKIGHQHALCRCPLSANNCHRPALLDHRVGASKVSGLEHAPHSTMLASKIIRGEHRAG